MAATTQKSTVPLEDYSKALDEIWHLRRALAMEATIADNLLHYSTLPLTGRRALEQMRERGRGAANGRVQECYRMFSGDMLRQALLDAGAPETLTRHAWENEDRA